MANSGTGPNFAEDGYVVFSAEESPFTGGEWSCLNKLVFGRRVDFELVTSGDTSERTYLLVNRLLLDGNPPKALDQALSEKVTGIIGTQNKLRFFEHAIGKTGLIVRRAQAHIMPVGGYIGCHRDVESSQHYHAAVILLLQAADEGGDFVIHRNDGNFATYPRFSTLITDARLAHEITPVLKGERRSFAFWLADASSP